MSNKTYEDDDCKLDDTSFKAGMVFGLQMAQSVILTESEDEVFTVHYFSKDIANYLQSKINNLNKGDE